jgi:hypothetical protein
MAPQGQTVRVKGYRELLRACDRAGPESKKEVRGALRAAGEIVRVDATDRFSSVDPRSARGYRVRVRQTGVAVEQSLRRTTGLHPEFGRLQMRDALIPALETKADDVVREIDKALETVEDHFER